MELIINLDSFNAKFLRINNSHHKKPNFFNILYNSPTLNLNNIIFETPWMDVPFGICHYNNNDEKQKNKYYIDLSFNGYNTNDELNNFYNCMNDIDDYVIDFLYQNRNQLNLSGNVENYYSKQIRFNKNNHHYPPTLKLKIFKGITKIQNTQDQFVDFDNSVKSGSKAKAIIRCNGLWVFNGKYGMSWKVVKLISKPTLLSDKINARNEMTDEQDKLNESKKTIKKTIKNTIDIDIDNENNLLESQNIKNYIVANYNDDLIDLNKKLSKIEKQFIKNLDYEIKLMNSARCLRIGHDNTIIRNDDFLSELED